MTNATITAGIALSLGLGAADLAYINLALAPGLMPVAPDPAPYVRETPPAPPAPTPAPVIEAEPVAVARVEAPVEAPVEVEPAPPVADEPVEQAAPPDTALLYFARNRATLGTRSREALDDVAALLQRDAALRVSIEGHADQRGTDDLNHRLSLRRADRAADYLAARGIERDRMDVLAFGCDRLLDPDETPTALQRNRRVAISFQRSAP